MFRTPIFQSIESIQVHLVQVHTEQTSGDTNAPLQLHLQPSVISTSLVTNPHDVVVE